MSQFRILTKSLVQVFFINIMIFLSSSLNGQDTFYDIDSVQEIRINFESSNWDYILDSLFVEGDKNRLLGQVVINGITIDSVGIRYKGFSSVSTERDKNPFNIKLDFVNDNQHYQGYQKIKLSNVIQDPSFLRETLSYEIARNYMPASRANYARVYVNGIYWGLYTNVEAVNKDMIENHFGSRSNAFFKCNPASLDFTGENANLGNSPGTDTVDYFPYYDIESENGWAELYELIDVLNTDVDQIESILNVDRTLWMHAFNYALINFDSYIGYAQNYYLYQDDNGVFNPILWDLNQSFGSYRLTDASENFDGFSVEQAKTIDPLLHLNSISIYPRPLMRHLFENDRYRKMFFAHIRTIIEEQIVSQKYIQSALDMRNTIVSSVIEDTNKFYSDEDYDNNINSTVIDLIEYPGITDLMQGRADYLQNYPGYDNAPEYISMDARLIGDDFEVNISMFNADQVVLAYRVGGSGLFTKVNMDNLGNGNFTYLENDLGGSIQYYLFAENESSGRFSPERAAYEYHTLVSDFSQGVLVINELMPKNSSYSTDEFGEYDDWIELYNNSNQEISLAGLYLSDDLGDLQKYALPNVSIPGNGYQVVWADGDTNQGVFHAGFKLSTFGEKTVLSNALGEILDSVSFGNISDDFSFGRIPNGVGPFEEIEPTINSENGLTNTFDILSYKCKASPNPAHEFIQLDCLNEVPNRVIIFDMKGAEINLEFWDSPMIDVSNFPNGIYVVK